MKHLLLILPLFMMGCATYQIDESISDAKSAALVKPFNGHGVVRIISVNSNPIPLDAMDENAQLQVPAGKITVNLMCEQTQKNPTLSLLQITDKLQNKSTETYYSYAISFDATAEQTYFFSLNTEISKIKEVHPAYHSQCNKNTKVCSEPKPYDFRSMRGCDVRIHTKGFSKAEEIDYEFVKRQRL
ncbi:MULTISPECIES: hypothetical protein [unclassified Pseudoalteromonas]|uniref:hypothetical protein n=1 Tax=unclassified Pseudoalteromonas TaxID=194690 RepID=UPI002359F4B4|nr:MULTISPECIES: hypothetical protein [unclassified Pseudoalteromonas]MDC9563372.1 hypothetical protein [Pseudoalteromonas sp. GAB2316C]MDC9572146.1 hypothetical protein [Pseudoalteromonas sp. GABNS16A]MDC9583819.1 hypothetical protein [Pseudoalteromonas sp. GABNS16C]MDC9607785.1 hypothetical protein [Pseudoalteromonas sp. GABNS16H]